MHILKKCYIIEIVRDKSLFHERMFYFVKIIMTGASTREIINVIYTCL